MKNKSGFTLIELLVVIAIIGILSSIVIGSLNRARERAADAKVKAQVAGSKTAGELYFDSNGDYGLATDLCDEMFIDVPSNMVTFTDPVNYPQGVSITCRSTNTEYALSISLPSGAGFYCIDSTGMIATIPVDLAPGDATCL